MRRWLLAFVLGLVSAAAAAAGYRIERIEPAHWWVGHEEHRLQLLVHGEGIAALEPAIADRARHAAQRHPHGKPELPLHRPAHRARRGSRTLRDRLSPRRPRSCSRSDYELLARAPGSAERRGFGPADAIYLAMPDRFANGDPANDSVDGLRGDARTARIPTAATAATSRACARASTTSRAWASRSSGSTPVLREQPAARVLPRLRDHGFLPRGPPPRRQRAATRGSSPKRARAASASSWTSS